MQHLQNLFLENFAIPKEYTLLFEQIHLLGMQDKQEEFNTLHKQLMKQRIQAVEKALGSILQDAEIPHGKAVLPCQKR